MIIYFLLRNIIYFRWLVETERYDEAHKVLKRIARLNGVKNYSSNREQALSILRERKIEYDLLNSDESEPQDLETNDLKTKTSCFNNEIFTKLFCSFKSVIKLLGLSFVFGSVSLNYFAVAIGVTTVLQINPYLMYLLSSLFEFAGLTLCHLNDVIGRRKVNKNILKI